MNTKNINLEKVDILLNNNREKGGFDSDTNYYFNNYANLSEKQKEDLNKAWEMLAILIINRPMFDKFVELTEDISQGYECKYIKDKSVKAIDFTAIFDDGKCYLNKSFVDNDLSRNKKEKIATIINYYTPKIFDTDAWYKMLAEIKEVENE